CTSYSYKRRSIGCSDYKHRTLQALLSEVFLNKLPYLPAALADKGDNIDIRCSIPRHHAQKHALPDTAAGHYPDPLALSDSKYTVYGTDTKVKRRCYSPSVQWIN